MKATRNTTNQHGPQESIQSKTKQQASHGLILQAYKDKTAQLQSADEEELVQGKFETTQLAGKEEELLQGKFDTVQRMGIDEEEPVQGKFETAQLATEEEEPLQRQPNNTGLPDNLKSGIENMSGYSMDDVKVHYNSSQPATLQAHAYAQGTDIHVAPGQEKHVPHEAWHVVQQKQGRVKPTMQMKGTVPVNDDAGLEKEADVMGAKALQAVQMKESSKKGGTASKIIQRAGKGAAIGTVIGAAIGALGFLAGPLGFLTMAGGGLLGGYIGHRATEPTDFAKSPANERIDPNEVGEENNGIRTIPEGEGRPDDVPLINNYRAAMHKLHNVVLVLKKSDRSQEEEDLEDPAPTNDYLLELIDNIQHDAKELAKRHKTSMRNLSSDTTADALKVAYEQDMAALTVRLNDAADAGERVIEANNYLNGEGTLGTVGDKLWRKQWLTTKRAVDTAMTALWNPWKTTLKAKAKTNRGDNAISNTDWSDRVDRENWKISYGGSLAKGYKGPPKQNTRFMASNFDVDANMDAPAIAEFLINQHHKTIDRGQLNPTGADTQIENMDAAMDLRVKQEMVNAQVVPNMTAANEVVSEQFETRVNASEGLGETAMGEVNRSNAEQEVRDKLTNVRNTDRTQLQAIMDALSIDPSLIHNNALISRPDGGLTPEEIQRVNQAIDAQFV